MNDAENLSKLLGHLKPESFRAFVADEFGVAMPEPGKKQTKTEQREAMATVLAALPVSERQRIEEVAEKIILLTDGAGQDVVDGFRADIFDDGERAAFDALRDQYERALWLYRHAEAVFKEALDARQADVFRQSVSCYSGFVAPKNLTMAADDEAKAFFHESVAQRLGCVKDDVAIQIFKRLRPNTQTGDDVDLYQISIHHNRPPEIIDCVQASELVAQEVIRAVSSHVTYEPANGYLEVLSKETDGREMLARIVADCLLKSPFSGEKIPLKQYDYQSLAAPRHFDLSGENVSSVTVVELGYSDAGGRSLVVKVGAKDPDGIHAASKSLVGPSFDFRHHPLNYARLSIRLKKVGKERARTISVILRDDNKCNIKTKREKDRALCDRLLAKWKLIKEVGVAAEVPADEVAA
jgi:hypothetical protein